MKPRADVLDPDDWRQPAVGSATTITLAPGPRRKREFPPGFHGAAPGPSHDEEAPPRPARPKKPKP